MTIKLDEKLVNAIWIFLNRGAEGTHYPFTEKLIEKATTNGWAFSHDVEDLLYYLDSRLAGHAFNVEAFIEAIGLRWTYVGNRPKSNSNYMRSTAALNPYELAYFLETLERCGFNTDPSYLVNLLSPSINDKSKMYFTEPELSVLWFWKTHRKQIPVEITAFEKNEVFLFNKRLQTERGYKIKAYIENDSCKVIHVTAPKFRNMRAPVRTTCPLCGYEWYKGDPDSSRSHRKVHKRRMYVLDPKPLQKLIQLRNSDGDPELVTHSSPAWKHFEMFERAYAFKQEFHYDFIQWQSPKSDDDPDAHGYLFGNENGAIIGACSFRKNDSEQGQPWRLDWVWICPGERRKGHLSKRWSKFVATFGLFDIEAPVSEAMQSFLNNKNF